MKVIEIVPAILVKTVDELNQRLKEVEPYVKRIHIDIMDDIFVPNKTIQPEDMSDFKTKLMKEVHLMVEDNEKYVDKFLKLGFDMIIVHAESCKDIPRIIKKVKDRGKKVALSINPPTPLSAIKNYLDDLDMVLIMSVNPGFSGQSFDPSVLQKIRELKSMKKDLDIEVDGGIKVGNARLVVEAGANIVVSCSGIYNFEDKKKAIEALRKNVILT
ncbi:MAG: ribulose-phosphate 3-epimerase [Candidatus Aenigmarchaeota archaeon]|nr:ribulose-phosphate 3-epimerase [Candidatus Aenigmarchaeota archaeon]